ncbi:MAG: hypothetical protein K6C14_08090 [Eubacterium sp.]|nr:hypothetical protein [Eubacterium sp.]
MKKTISILLCFLTVALCFFGCSGGEKEKSADEKLYITPVYDSAYESYDSSTVDAYKSLCETVLSYGDSVRMNTGLSEKVLRLYYTSFPLNQLVKDVTLNEDKSGLSITYVNEKEEHLKAVKAFDNKIKEINEACFSPNADIYTVKLYAYIASHVQLVEDKSPTCYDTLIDGSGTSFSYAQLLTYLLLVSGHKACYVTAADAANTAWGLVQAEIKGEWLYLDPVTEYYDNKGTKLLFFGMTYKDLKKEGLSEPVYSDSSAARDASSLLFKPCRSCKSYSLEDNSVVVSSYSGGSVKIEL